MAGETKGPWEIIETGDPEDAVLGTVYIGVREGFNADNSRRFEEHAARVFGRANAAHIVACVNACAGDYEVLQRHAEAGFEQAMHTVTERADALAAELRAFEIAANVHNEERKRLAAENAVLRQQVQLQSRDAVDAGADRFDLTRENERLRGEVAELCKLRDDLNHVAIADRAENERLRGALERALGEIDYLYETNDVRDSQDNYGRNGEMALARAALAGKGE